MSRKPFKPQVATANHLLEGDVIYLTETGWTRRLEEAAVAQDKATADALLARAQAQPDQTVGPHLVAVTLDDAGRATPAHYREAMRATGPSVRPDLGKQADL